MAQYVEPLLHNNVVQPEDRAPCLGSRTKAVKLKAFDQLVSDADGKFAKNYLYSEHSFCKSPLVDKNGFAQFVGFDSLRQARLLLR